MALYSATECEEQIEALDAEIASIRKLANRQMVGPIQVDYAGRIKDLQTERQRWRNEYRQAIADERAEEGLSSRGRGVNGPRAKVE